MKNKEDLSGLTGNLANLKSGAGNGTNPSDAEKDLTGLNRALVNHDSCADKGTGSSDSREDLSGLKEPSQYFSNCFNAYSRGVNLAVGRTGALFERPVRRITVTSEAYLLRLIVYIHQNPQKHGFESNFRDWKYSSYHELSSNVPTRLQREKVWDLFGSREDFIRIHQEIQPLSDFEDYGT